MTNEQMIERIRELRAHGLSPREIARNLGVRRAVVDDIVRALAAKREGAGDEDRRVDCLLNAGWSTGLKIDGHPEWHCGAAEEGTDGLVTALVARRRDHRHGAAVCVYLLDVYCLGVKNAMGPDNLDERRLPWLTDRAFSAYPAPPIAAPIELVRDLVFGAVHYAHQLGFAPHPDFEHAREHLGPWSGPSSITFGRDGKPTYVSGPDDDPDHVLRTLRRAVGRNGFNHTIGFDVNELPLAG